MEFTARKLTTKMGWGDLVIDEIAIRQLEEIRIWLQHSQTLSQDWGMNKKIKSGYKTLFHGPPGTGKTLTATLLGKEFNLEVYRIDLSVIVSKYIGETEKNLEKVFRKAENKNWILFFDEADALFGKRSNVSDSHDKYANQVTKYLLQRIADYSGLIILASNLQNNVEEGVKESLQSIIYFQKPNTSDRSHLFNKTFNKEE